MVVSKSKPKTTRKKPKTTRKKLFLAQPQKKPFSVNNQEKNQKQPEKKPF
jgi:hypothetical protein